MARGTATALLTLALFGAAGLPLVPCAGDRPRALAYGRLAIYALGSLVCHQHADRSFFSCQRQWPVCGRCTGLYLGAGLGAVVGLFGVGRRVTRRRWREVLVAAAVPTAVLWGVEMAGWWDPGSPVRAVVAGLLGTVGGVWLSAVARGDLR
jgi:uncharacterized membrane protein